MDENIPSSFPFALWCVKAYQLFWMVNNHVVILKVFNSLIICVKFHSCTGYHCKSFVLFWIMNSYETFVLHIVCQQTETIHIFSPLWHQIPTIGDFDRTQFCVRFIFHSSHNPPNPTRARSPLLILGQLSFKESGRIGSSPVGTPHHLMYSSLLPFLFWHLILSSQYMRRGVIQ